VGDHHDRPALLVEPGEELEDLGARAGVEVPGRLVGQQQRRAADQGAGDGDALDLAAGQLARIVVGPVAEPDLVEGLAGPVHPLAAPHAPVQQGRGDVLQRAGPAEQVEPLEHEPDGRVAQLGAAVVGQLRGVAPGQLVAARVGPVQQAEQVEQRRLARPGGADDGGPLAALDVQVDVAQDGDGQPPPPVGPRDPAHAQHGRRVRVGGQRRLLSSSGGRVGPSLRPEPVNRLGARWEPAGNPASAP
jgi:hypothetical protein